MLDAADMAAASAEHYARLDLPVKAVAERRAEELARMQAKRFRERAYVCRQLEDAKAAEEAARGDDTTGRYRVKWIPTGSWWKRWRFW